MVIGSKLIIINCWSCSSLAKSLTFLIYEKIFLIEKRKIIKIDVNDLLKLAFLKVKKAQISWEEDPEYYLLFMARALNLPSIRCKSG